MYHGSCERRLLPRRLWADGLRVKGEEGAVIVEQFQLTEIGSVACIIDQEIIGFYGHK